MSALTDRFPAAASIPHVPLGDRPTPVLPWDEFAEAAGLTAAGGPGSLWAKRDDATAPSYGGNKVRKLEYLLGRALSDGRRAVITFGAAGSNHVVATAVHGAELGLEVHAIMTPQAHTPKVPGNLLADLSVGANLHPVGSIQEALVFAEGLSEKLAERDGIAPFAFPFGGSSPIGILGYVDAALELAAQVEQGIVPAPDRLYVALGTLGTCTGLGVGLAAAGLATRVQAVRVLPAEATDFVTPATLTAPVVEILHTADPAFPAIDPAALPVDVREEFLGGGYAVPTPGAIEAVQLAADVGVQLETTYTGKGLAGLVADARAGKLEGMTVLFWDTYNSRPLPTGATIDDVPEPLREYFAEPE